MGAHLTVQSQALEVTVKSGEHARPGTLRSSRRALILIVLLAIVVRLAFMIAVQPWDQEVAERAILIGDATGYQRLALGIADSWDYESFGTFRTPGYPTFMATLYALFGPAPWIVLLAQVLLNCCAVVLLYLWADLVVGRKVALIAALLYAVEPHVVLYTSVLYSDTLFALCILAAMLSLTYGHRTTRASFIFLCGALLGAAALVKPVGQFFPIVAVGIVLLLPEAKAAFRLKAAFALVFAFALVISPWIQRNYQEYRHIGLATIQGSNLLEWNVAFAEVARTGRPVDEVRADFAEIARERGAIEDGNPFANSDIYTAVAMDYIKANKMHYAARHLKGIANMYLNIATARFSSHLGLDTGDFDYRFFASPGTYRMVRGFLAAKAPHEIIIAFILGGFLLLIYMAGAVGLISLIRARKWVCLLIGLGVIVYFSAITGVIGLVRYKLPIIPFYLVFSAQGFEACLEFVRKRRAARQGSAAEVIPA